MAPASARAGSRHHAEQAGFSGGAPAAAGPQRDSRRAPEAPRGRENIPAATSRAAAEPDAVPEAGRSPTRGYARSTFTATDVSRPDADAGAGAGPDFGRADNQGLGRANDRPKSREHRGTQPCEPGARWAEGGFGGGGAAVEGLGGEPARARGDGRSHPSEPHRNSSGDGERTGWGPGKGVSPIEQGRRGGGLAERDREHLRKRLDTLKGQVRTGPKGSNLNLERTMVFAWRQQHFFTDSRKAEI